MTDDEAFYDRLAAAWGQERPTEQNGHLTYVYPTLDLEPAPEPPPELHDARRAWLGLALLLAAFVAGWLAGRCG
jgi:hypothetical protein